jgi:hypothetical protein
MKELKRVTVAVANLYEVVTDEWEIAGYDFSDSGPLYCDVLLRRKKPAAKKPATKKATKKK